MRIYFASDTHLGAKAVGDKRGQEKRFVAWLDKIKDDADAIYLLGDIFDYWFEYGSVVPKGYVRFLGKLAQLSQQGIDIHIFTGNHDVWMFSYIQEECGVTVHTRHIEQEWDGKRFFVGHGDGLGNYDVGYNILKSVFCCRPIQILYSWLHPDVANWIATTWSRLSRKGNIKNTKYHYFLGDEEVQVKYVKECEEKSGGKAYDYYIFGHRHILADYETRNGARMMVIGDWLTNFSYAMWDGGELRLFKVDPEVPAAEATEVTGQYRYR